MNKAIRHSTLSLQQEWGSLQPNGLCLMSTSSFWSTVVTSLVLAPLGPVSDLTGTAHLSISPEDWELIIS